MENLEVPANRGRKRKRPDDVEFAENTDDAKCEEHAPEPNQEEKKNASDATECNFNFHSDIFGYSSLLHLLHTIHIFPRLASLLDVSQCAHHHIHVGCGFLLHN